MPDGLTDLLPFERQRLLAREYALRLSVVILWLITLLVLVAALLLLPTYVFLAGSASSKDAHLASIRAALASSDHASLSARLSALSNDAAALMALSDKPAVTKIVSTMLDTPRPGIILMSFVYTPGAVKGPGTLALSGVAATRDALRRYQLAFDDNPSIRSASLPVSAYAKDANIDFTITLTLTLAP